MKKFGLLLLAFLAHLGLTFAVVVTRLNCGINTACISSFNQVAGAILSFPLGLVVWAMNHLGLDASVLTDELLGGSIMLLCFLNSALAVCFAWYVVLRPLIGRRGSV